MQENTKTHDPDDPEELAPDHDEPGDTDLPEELRDLVTPEDEDLVPDNVDQKEVQP